MKNTIVTGSLIVFSDGFVWKRLSRKTAEALWNSVISHELELYWVRTDDESEAVIERFKDMERAFECGDYVCIEVGKLPYNMAFGYIHNLQEISSQAISRLTDTKDCSRDVAFAMIRVWAKEFTERYEDYKFDGDYYDLVDEFIDGKLCGKKWVNPYKPEEERFVLTLTDEERSLIEERIKAGHYSSENIEKRRVEAHKAKMAAKRAEICERYDKKIRQAEAEKKIMLCVFDYGLSTDNVIYYSHTNTLSFNWNGYGEKITQEEFDDFVNKVDRSQLPEGIKFELK